MKRKIEEVEKKLDENWEWFKSFDRRVYLLHVQMAAQVDKERKRRTGRALPVPAGGAAAVPGGAERIQQGGRVPRRVRRRQHARRDPGPPGLRRPRSCRYCATSWKALKKIIKDAREINLPAMKNFEEGENLAELHPRREDGAGTAAQLRQGRTGSTS